MYNFPPNPAVVKDIRYVPRRGYFLTYRCGRMRGVHVQNGADERKNRQKRRIPSISSQVSVLMMRR